ncbi:hypothetical protein H8356DRAFT_1418024 [Neocallimastix lanati (nom. inval.)]|nr:hypothetical protein H8356DRAFT_1418024 [Neocallimastix sp. JGI-2020a]
MHINFPNSSRPSLLISTIQRSFPAFDTDEGISVEIQCHSSNTSIPIELKQQLNVYITNAVITCYTSNNIISCNTSTRRSSMVGMGKAISNNFKNGVNNQVINSKIDSFMNFIFGNISTGIGVEALEKFNSDDQEKLRNEGITI